MKVVHKIQELRTLLEAEFAKKRIGLVPTMGALHQGHLSLIESSNTNCEITIATIFVNPAQFNNPEDLEKYPRTLEDDLTKLENANCTLVFVPQAEEIYPGKSQVRIDLGTITQELEGRYRPGHFNGVGLIIAKLFNIVQPHEAFFGQKDIQQYYVIKKLTDELNFPVKITMVGTQREPNGLAMSSRNLRLSSEERLEAGLIFRMLNYGQKMLLQGMSIDEIKAHVQTEFKASKGLTLEYYEVVDTENFLPLSSVDDPSKTAICAAAEIGGVRLIDNIPLIS